MNLETLEKRIENLEKDKKEKENKKKRQKETISVSIAWASLGGLSTIPLYVIYYVTEASKVGLIGGFIVYALCGLLVSIVLRDNDCL